MTLSLRRAQEEDLEILAVMNRCLIEDEGSPNPMSVPELAQRLNTWLHGDWQIVVFWDDDERVGYAVYQIRPNEYFPAQSQVYLRQMYIERSRRSTGLGHAAFTALTQTVFPPEVTEVVIDVLASNPRGYHFWSENGFQPYYTNMKFRRI